MYVDGVQVSLPGRRVFGLRGAKRSGDQPQRIAREVSLSVQTMEMLFVFVFCSLYVYFLLVGLRTSVSEKCDVYKVGSEASDCSERLKAWCLEVNLYPQVHLPEAVAWTVALVANKLAYDPGERNACSGSTTFWLLGVHGA